MKENKHATSAICVTKNGRSITYYHCDVCGQEHQSPYGATFDFDMCFSFSTMGRFKVCHRCGKKLAPMVKDFFESLHKDMEAIRANAPVPKNSLDWKFPIIEDE